MTTMFVAQQKLLGLSECERLCAAWSRDVEELAFRSGWSGMPGQRLNVPLGCAINMLILSIGKSHGLELQSMGAWLPGLRNETLLKLGEDVSNWSADSAGDAQREFWPMLYGRIEDVRRRIAPLLGCCEGTTTRKLRFHSQSDVEHISGAQMHGIIDTRTPRFTIDAHDLARRLVSVCGGQLFTVSAK